jgi:hypothetical protein
MVSMSGTDLNGVPIEEQFVPLQNYARIRTGSTHWTFVAIQVPDVVIQKPEAIQPPDISAV